MYIPGVLMALDSVGMGVPLAFVITSSECAKSIIFFLEHFLEKVKTECNRLSPGFTWVIRRFIIDKSTAAHNAITAVCPSSDIQLCWFHVKQAVRRWLITKRVSKKRHEEVFNHMRKMHQAKTPKLYSIARNQFLSWLTKEFRDEPQLRKDFGKVLPVINSIVPVLRGYINQ